MKAVVIASQSRRSKAAWIFLVYCCLLFHAPQIASAEEEPKVAKGVADYWIQTEQTRACEGNEEGIKHTAVRYFIDSASSCRRLCERRAECLAVDFYVNTKVCLFFADECVMPRATADGATSYRLARQAEWELINSTAACEGNEEGIRAIMGFSHVMSSEECRQECERRGRCRAVDYYRDTWHCNLFEVPCKHPRADHDGASSYRIVRQLKAQSFMESRQADFFEAKTRHDWQVHSKQHACEKNSEGLSPIWRAKVENFAICSALCVDNLLCTAFDYYSQDFECLLYKKLCVKPRAQGGGASSWGLKVQESLWEVISQTQGCSKNKEGVDPVDSTKLESLENCKQLCERIYDCVGVDWNKKDGNCVVFNQSCLKPLRDGFSSYLITRTVESPIVAGGPQSGRLARSWDWLRRHFRRQQRRQAQQSSTPPRPWTWTAGLAPLASVSPMFTATAFATCWLGGILVFRCTLRMLSQPAVVKYL